MPSRSRLGRGRALAELARRYPRSSFVGIPTMTSIVVSSTSWLCWTNETPDHHGNLDHMFGPFLYTLSCMHCMTVSFAQGGEGLGTMWGVEKADELLRAAGFAELEYHWLEHDPVNVYVVARA